MTEEASEKLVKLFLESQGYLIKSNIKKQLAKNKIYEIDLLGINNKTIKNFPRKLLVEVKSYPLSPNHISQIKNRFGLKSRDDSSRLKLFNNKLLRKRFLSKIEREYGKGFSFMLVTRGVQKKHEAYLKDYLKKNNIIYLSLNEVIKGIVKYALKTKYSNDSELQLIRLMRDFDWLNKDLLSGGKQF